MNCRRTWLATAALHAFSITKFYQSKSPIEPNSVEENGRREPTKYTVHIVGGWTFLAPGEVQQVEDTLKAMKKKNTKMSAAEETVKLIPFKSD